VRSSSSRKNAFRYLLRRIRERLNRGKNVIIVIEGDTGSGKSSASISIAWHIDEVWQSEPEVAAKMLIVFSALEFLAIVRLLLERREEGELYRGRFIVVEEAGAGASGLSTGAVQEMRNVLEVFRQWQINVIFNLPLASRIESIKYEFAHFAIWCKDVIPSERVVLARLKERYRDEQKIAFVNPFALQAGFTNSQLPGALMRIPWAPESIWNEYQKQKMEFFTKLTERGIKRSLRLGKRGDLSQYIVRDHFQHVIDEVVQREPEIVRRPRDIIDETLMW